MRYTVYVCKICFVISYVCACFLKLEIAIHRLFQPFNSFPRRVCNEHVLGQRAFRICVGHGARIKITLIGYLHSIRQRIFERKGAGGFNSSNIESWYLFIIRVMVALLKSFLYIFLRICLGSALIGGTSITAVDAKFKLMSNYM